MQFQQSVWWNKIILKIVGTHGDNKKIQIQKTLLTPEGQLWRKNSHGHINKQTVRQTSLQKRTIYSYIFCQNLCFFLFCHLSKLFEFCLSYPSALSVVQTPCVLVSAVSHPIDCIISQVFSTVCLIISQSLCYLKPSSSVVQCQIVMCFMSFFPAVSPPDFLVWPILCTPTFDFGFCFLLYSRPLACSSDFWFWTLPAFCFYWTALWFWPLACDIISDLDYLCWFSLLEYWPCFWTFTLPLDYLNCRDLSLKELCVRASNRNQSPDQVQGEINRLVRQSRSR